MPVKKEKSLHDYPKAVIIQWIEEFHLFPLFYEPEKEFDRLDFIKWQRDNQRLLDKAKSLMDQKSSLPSSGERSAKDMAKYWELEGEITKVFSQLNDCNRRSDKLHATRE